MIEMHSGIIFFGGILFRGSGRSNMQFFHLVRILCSCTRQYECGDVLGGFWGPGDGFRSDTGSKTVAGQFFASIIFCSRVHWRI